MSQILNSAVVLDDGTFTPAAGTNRRVIYAFRFRRNLGSVVPSSVTFGGVAMTQDFMTAYFDADRFCFYSLKESDGIPEEESTIAVTMSDEGNTIIQPHGVMLTIDGLDQTTALDDSDSGAPTGNTTLTSGALTNSESATLISLILQGFGATSSDGWDALGSNNQVHVHALDEAPAATDETYQWTSTGSSWKYAIVAYKPAAAATAPVITDVSDVTLTHGQTGVVITGTGFSASGNTVLVSPTDDVEDVLAVAQTITAEGATEITFTADLDSFDFGTLYLFVVNGDSESNETGEVISRVVGSATLNFTGDDIFIDENGDPQASIEDLTFLVWRSPRPTGAPDQTLTEQATDENGELVLSIDVGSLEDGDTVFFVCFAPDGTDLYSAGEMLPEYA